MNTKPIVKQLEWTSLDSLSDLSENPVAIKLAAEQPFVSVPRVRRPNRGQVECLPFSLDELLPEEHEARAVWDFVEGQNFQALYEKIQAVAGNAGRPAIDPKIFLTLWLYATLKGVGSARELERLCENHLVYRWICGGVSVNYHSLADFRVDHGNYFDKLLTENVAVLIHEGLVDIRCVEENQTIPNRPTCRNSRSPIINSPHDSRTSKIISKNKTFRNKN